MKTVYEHSSRTMGSLAVFQIPPVVFIMWSLCAIGGRCMPGQTILEATDSPQGRHVFHMADLNNDEYLTYGEFLSAFRMFDENGDGNVTFAEFSRLWEWDNIGKVTVALRVFLNLDVDRNAELSMKLDVPYVWRWFDINGDMLIHEGEFIIQWVKLSS